MLVVRDKEAGNIIEKIETTEEGLALIKRYEDDDKANDTYEPDFYEVVEI